MSWLFPALLILTAGSPAPNASPPRPEEKWLDLFNGRDLTGWEGQKGCWSVEDGAITGRTSKEAPLAHHSFLIWRGGHTGDFELQLQFRMQVGGNSGIQYRSRDLGDFNVAGYQYNLEPHRVSYTAILEEMKGRPGHLAGVGEVVHFKPGERSVTGSTGAAAQINDSLRKDGWNEVKILAQGPRLRHWLNNQLAVDVTDEDPKCAAAKGILALQLHTGPPMWIQFKNIRLRHVP